MIITDADTADLAFILALQYEAYQSEAILCNNPRIPLLVQTLEQVAQEFAHGVILKAVDEQGDIIGSVRAVMEEGTAKIGKLIARPDCQGRGIGTALLQAIETRCPAGRYELFTSSQSERNIRLYIRHGYREYSRKTMPGGLVFVYLEKLVTTG